MSAGMRNVRIVMKNVKMVERTGVKVI